MLVIETLASSTEFARISQRRIRLNSETKFCIDCDLGLGDRKSDTGRSFVWSHVYVRIRLFSLRRCRETVSRARQAIGNSAGFVRVRFQCWIQWALELFTLIITGNACHSSFSGFCYCVRVLIETTKNKRKRAEKESKRELLNRQWHDWIERQTGKRETLREERRRKPMTGSSLTKGSTNNITSIDKWLQ